MSLVVHLYDLPAYDLHACLALISSAFVCVVVHVTQKGYPIRCYGDTFGYPSQGPHFLCRLLERHVHINGKGVPGAVTFTATLSQLARP